ELIHAVQVSKETLDLVKEGFWEVVNKPGGTAYNRARIDGLNVSGKTGTAQVIRQTVADKEKKCPEVDYKFRDHALFAAYAPREQPEIAVGVIVEHGCHGSVTAAPIAKAVIEAYFYKKKILQEKTKKEVPKK
ncbi:MAG: penicillin-binding protein 2, partial [Candidatus Sungbacteria bacterium]|nr:penicillin-binding protein 2 [Candidatus Sungbacteria bacterium]